ncbi:HAD family hydrolase [Mucilaginibacter sp. RS28]|uniref:HAD family hydrolase n=1 Tax=Mucilaginibacter straminoryzae TaxID=2932774 RepID=A0A9X2B9W5_9SPHI|nr:HAD hydrolase-like protein [Mucilaginibacter straminoryzae]MCJ8211109.1 HAD family hydrolase [Mucilaginibacter straminoryzae]
MVYSDLDYRKTAFIFELDNVLYPEKDYLLQVYYLFSNFLEYTEMTPAKEMLGLMTKVFEEKGADAVLDAVQVEFKLDEKYRQNFAHLMVNAKLPLKLLLYQKMLQLLQDIVVDRKKIFIVTNGHPPLQLNKIRQTDWNGLEKYLTCYFANEYAPKPEPDAIHTLIKEHQLERRELLMIGNGNIDEATAEAAGIDYISVDNFLNFN